MLKILSGDEHQIKSCKQELVAGFEKAHGALAVQEVDVEAQTDFLVEDLMSLLATASLFCPQRLVIVKNMKMRPEFQGSIEAIIDSIGAGVTLVIIEAKMDKASAYGRLLRQQADFIEYKPYKGRELECWLVERAGAYGTSLEHDMATYMIQRAGEEALLLDAELQKLRVHPTITKELIDHLVSPGSHSQVFDLLDAIMQGRLQAAMAVYRDQRLQKSEPLSMLGLFVWQLRVLLIVVHGLGSEGATARFGVNPYALNKSRALAKSLGAERLRALIDLCYFTDRKIRVEFIDADEAMLFLVCKGCHLIRR